MAVGRQTRARGNMRQPSPLWEKEARLRGHVYQFETGESLWWKSGCRVQLADKPEGYFIKLFFFRNSKFEILIGSL